MSMRVMSRTSARLGRNVFFFNDTAPTEIYTLSLPAALPISNHLAELAPAAGHIVHMPAHIYIRTGDYEAALKRSEEHTSELQSRLHLVCRLLLEKKKSPNNTRTPPLTRPVILTDSHRAAHPL